MEIEISNWAKDMETKIKKNTNDTYPVSDRLLNLIVNQLAISNEIEIQKIKMQISKDINTKKRGDFYDI